MNLLDQLIHLLNFIAPAMFMALALPLAARLLGLRSQRARRWLVQVAGNFAVGVAVLVAGLWFFGADGRIASYAALVVACATSQWWLGAAWRGK
ncbi:MAG: hypothetical protein Q7T63_08135 [Burkholderiaceae bacterium]|nr:hypothetical protein [Burkholderiaceae bacterium]MDO9090866.1 hypothetical protein [Burkholderiaceae bacterium]